MSMVEDRPHLITDIEKTYAFLGKLCELQGEIRDKLQEDAFTIDMYGSDPGGVYGQIGALFNSATLPRQYNGPIIIETILASWAEQSINGGDVLTGEGSVTTPGAFATIASTGSTPAGTYQVYVTFNMSGTPAAGTDNNNLRISSTGATPNNFVLDNNIGTAEQTFGPFEMKTTGTTISVQSINAATTGAIYSAQITATPTSIEAPTSVTLAIADRTIQLAPSLGIFNPQGLKIQVQRDDQIVLTCTPAVPCYLEVMGYADLRKRDYIP